MTRTVSEFMTPHPTVVEVTDTLHAVAQTMATQDVGSLVVAENGAVVGIVTDRDLVVRGFAQGIGLDAPVGQLATDDVVTVGPDDDVDEVVRIMRERGPSRPGGRRRRGGRHREHRGPRGRPGPRLDPRRHLGGPAERLTGCSPATRGRTGPRATPRVRPGRAPPASTARGSAAGRGSDRSRTGRSP